MIPRVIIRAEAKRDLREAKSWYQNISPELKRDFVRRIGEAIALAQESRSRSSWSIEHFEGFSFIGFRMHSFITSITIASSL
jgi:plasmid stabilization system protein ParE